MTLIQDQGILIAQRTQGKSHIQSVLRPDKANRHGLITGATGTGKTITLQTLAEGFSALGIPVFMADVKGDLTGMSQPGRIGEKLAKVLAERGFDAPDFVAFPTTLWDVFGQQGHPVRATVSDLGPLLLARMLNLNETQAGVLQLVFKIADDDGLLLLDMKDLRALHHKRRPPKTRLHHLPFNMLLILPVPLPLACSQPPIPLLRVLMMQRPLTRP